jgi:hypothetical protein
MIFYFRRRHCHFRRHFRVAAGHLLSPPIIAFAIAVDIAIVDTPPYFRELPLMMR